MKAHRTLFLLLNNGHNKKNRIAKMRKSSELKIMFGQLSWAVDDWSVFDASEFTFKCWDCTHFSPAPHPLLFLFLDEKKRTKEKSRIIQSFYPTIHPRPAE